MGFVRVMVAVLVMVINIFPVLHCTKAINCSMLDQTDFTEEVGSTMELSFSVPPTCIPVNDTLRTMAVYDLRETSTLPDLFCQIMHGEKNDKTKGKCQKSHRPLNCVCDPVHNSYTVRVPLDKPGKRTIIVVCEFLEGEQKIQQYVNICVSDSMEPGGSENPTTPGAHAVMIVSSIVATVIIVAIIVLVLYRKRNNLPGATSWVSFRKSANALQVSTGPPQIPDPRPIEESLDYEDVLDHVMTSSTCADVGQRSPAGACPVYGDETYEDVLDAYVPGGKTPKFRSLRDDRMMDGTYEDVYDARMKLGTMPKSASCHQDRRQGQKMEPGPDNEYAPVEVILERKRTMSKSKMNR